MAETSLCGAGNPEGFAFDSAARSRAVEPLEIFRNLGGADRVRTDDLRLAKPALSQLSYSPELIASRRIATPSIVLPSRPHRARRAAAPADDGGPR